jgi:ubiquinone/menaquinone biosynthesis C-methylase UbiE
VGGDVTKLPFRDRVFDVVTSFGVIEHFRNESEVIATLSEAHRVLKVGGYLIIIIPNFAATFRNKLVIALTKGRFGMYHKPYTRSALVSYLEVIKGMQIVEDGFLPFGFRSLILSMFKRRSIEKIIYFLYHAVWCILNSMLKIVGDNYQNAIYLVAKRIR